ncbi:MAG TPA: NmrA family NAD(P)-binding protein [Chitinophagaceae bacterium]|nr:NmrA family NAD(P)-binding protein [Chitinophagaceae bacterium]
MDTKNNRSNTIIVAGATGHLGQKICANLISLGATVKALVRNESNRGTLTTLHKLGVQIIEVDFNNTSQLVQASSGSSCVVSALSGVRDIIVDLQTKLLNAAVEAGIARFIPSDYCIDYTKLPYGSNRNLDLRREFNEILDKTSIKSTSILNGMFTDLLLKEAPVVLFKIKRVMYWGRNEQLLDFTTMGDTAAYTAYSAMDDNTPRYLRVAGDQINAKGLRDAATQATGKKFHLLRPGGLGLLKTMISITKTLSPGKNEVFPAWQGMQYMHNMYTGLPKLEQLDNDRYPIEWTSVKEVLSTHE